MADLLTVEVAKERAAELRRVADRHRLAAGDSRRLPVARNTALLAGAVAANAAIVELSAAVASISLVRLVDVGGLLGLGPAIVLAAGALAAVPAGRSMDRFGRAPVLAGGFAVGGVRRPQQQPAGTARIGQLLRRPGVVTALVAGQVSVGVMVAVMMLTGPIVVERLHHDYKDVFPIIGAQVLGMYALVIVVGEFIDRIGRLPALSGGLLLMGVSVSGLVWTQDLRMLAVALFALGLGWSISFVAATAELADRATAFERGACSGSTIFWAVRPAPA
jgi:MFS family permease